MVHVSYCQETIPMVGKAGLNWLVAIERLKLHDLWDLEIEQALTILDEVMVTCAEEERPKEEQPSED